MRVLSLCEYFIGEWAPDHFKSGNIVKAIKGEVLRGYADLTIQGRRKRLDSSHPEFAIEWAVEGFTQALKDAGLSRPISIVPIPGHKHCSSAEVASGPVFQLADALAMRLRKLAHAAHAQPLIYWAVPQQSAHSGGGVRDAGVLQQRLRVDGSCQITNILLIDDVVTSGSHLQAAYALLSASLAIHDLALAVGRTVHVKGDPMRVAIEECPRPMDASI